MVIAPIAAAAAPTVVASATEDDGLINKLFKIGILAGGLVLLAISIVILSFLIEIGSVVGSVSTVLSIGLSPLAGSIPLIGPFISAITFGLSAFGWGGRR
jgi:hypothetical protein